MGLQRAKKTSHRFVLRGDPSLYRSKCYELSINIAETRFENFVQGAVREFTSRDEQRVTNELTMILNSLRFLN